MKHLQIRDVPEKRDAWQPYPGCDCGRAIRKKAEVRKLSLIPMLKIECQTVSHHWCMEHGSGGICPSCRDWGALIIASDADAILVGHLGKKQKRRKLPPTSMLKLNVKQRHHCHIIGAWNMGVVGLKYFLSVWTSNEERVTRFTNVPMVVEVVTDPGGHRVRNLIAKKLLLLGDFFCQTHYQVSVFCNITILLISIIKHGWRHVTRHDDE